MNPQDIIRIEKKLAESTSRMLIVAILAYIYVSTKFYLSWNEYDSVLALTYIILNPVLICAGFLFSKKEVLNFKIAGFIFLTSSGFFSTFYFYMFYNS